MLDVLVYTDSAEHEALHGGTGFQFIAASPGATPADEAFVRGAELQHVVPQQLDASAWATHPPTCAYRANGDRLYLSRGRSTGDTIGGRPGNQSTTTVVTSDARSVLPLRPAQLFSSPSWPVSRPETQTLEAWVTPVPIAPDFEVGALHDLCLGSEPHRSALPAVLTMLERTQDAPRVKLLLRHDDQRVVMRWVALLSCFLDAEAALHLSFRVFSPDPLGEDADLVGVHPKLSPGLDVDSARGVHLFDLESGRYTPVEPSAAATRQAEWFLSGDPFEALDAIETARRWSRCMDAATATEAAGLATMSSTRVDADGRGALVAASAIRALACAGAHEELEVWGDELTDVVADGPPRPADELVLLDDTIVDATRSGEVGIAADLLLTALEWAAAVPALAAEWARRRSAAPEAHVLGGGALEHAGHLVAAVLAASTDAELSDAFTLAGRFVERFDEQSSDAVERLAACCLREPTIATDHPGIGGDRFVRRLAPLLGTALERGDPNVSAAFADGAFDWLRNSDEPALVPLSRWFVARDAAGAPADVRHELLLRVRGDVPAEAWRVFLETPAGVDPDEVVGWLASHSSVPADLATLIEDACRRPDSAWARRGERVLDRLARGTVSVPPPLQDLVARHLRIRAALSGARERRDAVPNPQLAELRRSDSDTVGDLHGDRLLTLLPSLADVRGIVQFVDAQRQPNLTDRLGALLVDGMERGDVSALRAALVLQDDAYGRWSSVARGALDDLWDDPRRRSACDRLAAAAELELSAQEADRFRTWLDSRSRGRLTRSVLRGARTLFSNRNDGR